jgi:serine O-acetyltransferase
MFDISIFQHNPAVARLLFFLIRRNWRWPKRALDLLLGGDITCPLPHQVFMPHPYGITIHCGTQIGKNVVIMQQVTIGGRHTMKDAPIIEDEVFIGAGAKILGGVRIGHHARIGANAVVTKDVPPYATVVEYNRIIPAREVPGETRPPAPEAR